MKKQELEIENLRQTGLANVGIINSRRGSGKTVTLLRAAAWNNGIYVALTKQHIDNAKRLCMINNIDPPKMTCYKDLEKLKGLNWEGRLYCDDVATHLASIAGTGVETIVI